MKLRDLRTRLLEKSQRYGGDIQHIKINPYITVFPIRTETLPPATHTNCFIVGALEFSVIDAGSPFAEEQAALHTFIDSLIAQGKILKSLIITHLHRDHISGVIALQNHLKEKFDLEVPIAAHRLTAESLQGEIQIERYIEDNEVLEFKTNQEDFRLLALHTPGHARGHLCFYDERHGFLLSGDNVVGIGSVLIALPEGNMKDYLASLERMKNLLDLRFLCGAHGAAIYDAKGKIESYIQHRLERESAIIAAVKNGAGSSQDIVREVYKDVSPDLWKLAELAIETHLEKIEADKLI